jgi:hypothetical protein
MIYWMPENLYPSVTAEAEILPPEILEEKEVPYVP